MKIPITQSRAWERLQKDLGEPCFYEEGKGYQYLAIKKSTPVGSYLYLPYGPVSDTKQGISSALKDLTKLAKKESCIFIRIEPQLPDFTPSRNTKKSTDLNPKETWLLDLGGTDEELKAKLPSRLLRYYRNTEKNGLTIEESHNPDDIKYLFNLQQSLAKEKGINTFSERYLKTEAAQPFATIYLVKQAEKVLAAGLVFDHDGTRYNLQGAQSDEGRRLHATGILTIQLILDAKAKNLQTFDFWGIAPEGAPENHPWAGFTNFKKTFKGYERNYAGTHDVIIDPFKHRLYTVFRKLNRLIRK